MVEQIQSLKPRMNADGRGSGILEAGPMNDLTEQVIGCAFSVSNKLGCGFLEKMYENALAHEIRKIDLPVQQQQPIQVVYDGAVVGDYLADLVVNDCLIIELKVAKSINSIHIA
jgi:GxxExxY protein